MEKGWRKWNGETWEHVSLSDMIEYVISTGQGQELLKKDSLVTSWIQEAVIDAYKEEDPDFISQNLAEEIEIFDKFRERIYKVRNGLMDIKDFYADEKSNL